ncbi:MAG: hypothetical protein HOV67_10965, partial [Kribbellaceae bacterium]|nr:hypothetical protein [Kribbellaceae bacterium]
MTADRVHLFLQAVASLDATVTADVYWAGRTALCSGPDDTARYDEVFAAWFTGDRARGVVPSRTPQTSVQAALESSDGGDADDADRTLSVSASRTEVLRHRDVAGLSTIDRAELARLYGTLRPRAPLRRAHRRRPSH